MEGGAVQRKRKSNFDVPPEGFGVTPSEIQMRLQELSNSISAQLAQCSNPTLPTWESVTDTAYRLRLEKALQRNFEYIHRY